MSTGSYLNSSGLKSRKACGARIIVVFTLDLPPPPAPESDFDAILSATRFSSSSIRAACVHFSSLSTEGELRFLSSGASAAICPNCEKRPKSDKGLSRPKLQLQKVPCNFAAAQNLEDWTPLSALVTCYENHILLRCVQSEHIQRVKSYCAI
ncbi:hypothetical protein Mapa_016515 [Marchantia paleacea]|nr:hypothetical protein Mapa_016515 [Marchantia paleacea]